MIILKPLRQPNTICKLLTQSNSNTKQTRNIATSQVAIAIFLFHAYAYLYAQHTHILSTMPRRTAAKETKKPKFSQPVQQYNDPDPDPEPPAAPP